MATFDFSVQPKKVTLTNVSTGDVQIQFYRNYNNIKVAAGDSIVVKTVSSAEEAYYLSLAQEGLITAVAAEFDTAAADNTVVGG